MKKLLGFIIYSSLRVYNKSSQLSHNFKWKIKIKNLLKAKNIEKLSKGEIDEIKAFYSEYGLKNIETYWHNFYTACNGNFSARYIPENLFYSVIEPKLNDRAFASVLADKNLLEKLFPSVRQPDTIVKNINGFFFASGKMIDLESVGTHCNKYKTIFIKPTIETGGGKNVSAFNIQDDLNRGNKILFQLLRRYDKNFIIQQKVEQHEIMFNLNPTSLNTFRVMSYLKNKEVIVLSTIVRMGMKGSITDNSTTGGVSCGVKPNGSLNKIGFQLSGQRFESTSTGIKFEDIHLPFMPEILSTVQKLHIEVPYFQVISWDLAVDRNGEVILIELNIKGQDITFHQLNNGPVLTTLLEEL